MEYQRKIIETGDGSKTLFIPEMNEQYHSVNGARTESEYVFIDKGFRFHPANAVHIFEIGFGTGLNALLTALEAGKQKKNTRFTSIEKYPLNENEIEALDYGNLWPDAAVEIFKAIHAASWNTNVKITEYFTLRKIQADMKNWTPEENSNFDIIYFDAFGPDKQPGMWQKPLFEKIYEASNQGAVFVTYSAKGEIRRRLESCGFKMERLPGPPGKRQMLRGLK